MTPPKLSPEAQAFRDDAEKALAEPTRVRRGHTLAARAVILDRLARLFDERRSERDHVFPIQGGPAIPLSVIAPCEAQAMRNHSQTLARLAQRGGLCSCEAIDVLLGQKWNTTPHGAGEVERLSQIVRDRVLESVSDHRLSLILAARGWPLPEEVEAARREVERLRAALTHAEEWMSVVADCTCVDDEPGMCGLCVARAALTPSTVDPEPQPAEVNRDELHDIAGQVLALFVPSCPECCTPETDGDLCDPCAGKIADIERLLSRGAR